MKTNIKILIQSIAILLACTMIFSLVFAGLYYFHIIPADVFHILNWMFGALAYGAAGCFLGFGINKKALLHAFGFVLVCAILALLMMDGYTLMNLLQLSSKLILYLLGCIFAISRKS